MQRNELASDTERYFPPNRQTGWSRLIALAITIMTALGLNRPLTRLTENAGCLWLIVYLAFVLFLVAIWFGLHRFLSAATRLVRGIPNRPWTPQSRPPRWRLTNFTGSEHGWKERLDTIIRRRKETYIRPSQSSAASGVSTSSVLRLPMMRARLLAILRDRGLFGIASQTGNSNRSMVESPVKLDTSSILIAFLDDAYGLKVTGKVPAMLYCDGDDNETVARTARWMIEAASEHDKKVCVVIVPSRKADSKFVGGMFERTVKRVAYAIAAIRAERPMKPRWAIRIDSCLRTHFGEELIAIERALSDTLELGKSSFDYYVFAPCNVDEGRITNFGVQYYKDHHSGEYRPMAEDVEYALRHGFAYQDSNLAIWIDKKTDHKITRNAIHSDKRQ